MEEELRLRAEERNVIMQIGIVSAASLRFSPYAFYYMRLLDEMGLDYEVVVPDRYDGVGEGYAGKLHILPWDSRRNTLFNYVSYAENVKKLAVKRFDFLIVLTTNLGVFCYPWLKKYYDKRYILDIRDYTHENNPFFFALEKRAVQASALNVVSSRKFQTFLPQGEYLPCHNITTPMEPSPFRFQKANGRIAVAHIGATAYADQCRMLMDLVCGDERFEFHFYGTGPTEPALRSYAERLGCSRIHFSGAYRASEKGPLIQKVDMLFTVYGNEGVNAKYLLANKLYDALYYHKPLLVTPGTFMAEMGGELACSLDLRDLSALDRLWDWYQALEPEWTDAFADRRYAALVEEHRQTGEEIKRLLTRILEKED